MAFNHQPSPPWLRRGAITAVVLSLAVAGFLYVTRGFNEILLVDAPDLNGELIVIDYNGCGGLDHERYTISGGRIRMDWGYSPKGSRLRYLIRENDQTVAEGTMRFAKATHHELAW